jgi:signal transduction histidine kinase
MVESSITLLAANNIYIAPIVKEEECTAFEAFAKANYATDPELSGLEDIGVSDFGFGVFALDDDGNRFHNNRSEVPFETEYDYLTPIIQLGRVPASNSVRLVNPRYAEARGLVQDHVADCFSEKIAAGLKGPTVEGCAALTDFTELVFDSKAKTPKSIFYFPVAPAGNYTVLTAFIGVVLYWDTIIEKMLPAFSQEYSLYLVLESPISSLTFLIEKDMGTVVIDGGDHHDSAYNSYRRTGRIDNAQGMSALLTEFKFSIYPHGRMLTSYYSNQPITLAIAISLVVFAFIFIIFALDFFVVSHLYEAELLSSMRKVFLRYISHEIRTPLNAVYMSVTDLLVNHDKDVNSSGGADGLSTITSTADVIEMKRNLESAIVVLDDLVTYVRVSDSKNGCSYKDSPIVCATQILGECVRSIQDTSTEYGTTFRFTEGTKHPGGGPPTIKGDATDLRLIFTYILKLAVKMGDTNDEPISLDGKQLFIIC